MPNFKYAARDRYSKLVSGTTAAVDAQTAVKKLSDMGYAVVTINQEHSFQKIDLFSGFQRVRLEEINSFTRQLYSLQKAGVPLLSCLESIAMETENLHFRAVIEEIARDIKEGVSFSEALQKHKKIFDDVYVNMLKAAESGGLMVSILERLTGLIEQEIDTRARVRAATRYPMIAFVTLCLGFLVLVIFVIPRFTMLYSQFNVELPLPTRILIAVNFAVKKFWYIVIPLAAASIFLFIRFINSRVGRPLWDNLKLKAPVLGPLVSMLTMSRFSRITAVLMKSGVPILEVLNLVANTAGNIIIKRAILNIRDSVNQGRGIAEPMKATNLFPPIVIQMVSIGEQSGKVDELLLSVADYYDRETGYMIKNLTTYIEPILILVLGIMVLIMALGVFMPMWNLIKVFKPS